MVYLKTTERVLADRVRAREIPHIKDGKFTKFKREDLDAYMESRHTKITTTQIYAKVLDEGRKKAVDAIPDL